MVSGLLRGLFHQLVRDGLADRQAAAGLHRLARLGHGRHVLVQRVRALLHCPEGVEEVVIDLEVPPLDLAPRVPPRLEGVLREEAGQLLEGVHCVLVPLDSRVQHLEEKDSRIRRESRWLSS